MPPEYRSDVDYSAYISSEEWANKSTKAKRDVGYRCQICNRHEDEIVLDTHHRTYERLGSERPDDLTVLCRDCHALYEDSKRLSRYGFRDRVSSRLPQPIASSLAEYFERYDPESRGLRSAQALPTGFVMLDKLLGGFSKSSLTLVTAPPGTGKTAFLSTLLLNMARYQECTVAFFSLQTSSEQMTTRLLSIDSHIELLRLKHGEIHDEEWPILMESANSMSSSGLLIDDTPALTSNQIRRKCIDIHQEVGLDLIVIDAIEMIKPSTHSSSWHRENIEIAHGIKNIALELNVPIVASLSVGIPSRTEKRLRLDDIPTHWYQVADNILALYREDFWVRDTDRQNLVDFTILKNREGIVDAVISLFFKAEFGRFRDLELLREELDI